MRKRALHSLAGVALVFAATGAAAQDETDNRVAAQEDWAVFEYPPLCSAVEDDDATCRESGNAPDECFVVSAPTNTVNTKNGNVVSVERGEIRLFVSWRPQDDVVGEVSFTGGYPLAADNKVKLRASGETFDLSPYASDEPAWAWPEPDDDDEIVDAFKNGAEAVVTGLSTRGTTTKDTFSLMGFTAAAEDAAARCQS